MSSNILFILIDSLRADKFYQRDSKNNPTIRKLIQEGTYFTNAFSSSDYTITGYGSIFTSRYPINAGLTGMNYHKIFSKNQNFISLLQDNGYHTYTTMDNSFQNLGFSSYFENQDQGYDRAEINLFEGLDKKIINKIKSGKLKEPWFYFIHLDDLHIPVRVPKKYESKKYSERYDIVVSKIDSWLHEILKNINLEKTLVIITSDHGDYILSIDDAKKQNFNTKIKSKLRNKISRKSFDLLSTIKQDVKKQVSEAISDPIGKRTLNSRTAERRYLFDDVIHIPLLFVGKNIQKNGVKDNLVRSVDIFPTIWNLLNLPKINFKIDGQSLIPFIEGKTLKEIPVYLENTVFATGQKVISSCIGLRTKKYKYFRPLMQNNPSEAVKRWWKNLSISDFDLIKLDPKFSNIDKKLSWNRMDSNQHESVTAYYNMNITTNIKENNSGFEYDDVFLYDLESDPNELKNIAKKEPKISLEYEKNLNEIRDKLQKEFDSPELDDEEFKKIETELKKLGYI